MHDRQATLTFNPAAVNNYWYIGIIRNGLFTVLASDSAARGSFRLTTAAPGSDSPEAEAVEVVRYEETALMVRGVDNGSWIFAATVVEQAGELLTAVIEQVFDGPNASASHRSDNDGSGN